MNREVGGLKVCLSLAGIRESKGSPQEAQNIGRGSSLTTVGAVLLTVELCSYSLFRRWYARFHSKQKQFHVAIPSELITSPVRCGSPDPYSLAHADIFAEHLILQHIARHGRDTLLVRGVRMTRVHDMLRKEWQRICKLYLQKYVSLRMEFLG